MTCPEPWPSHSLNVAFTLERRQQVRLLTMFEPAIEIRWFRDPLNDRIGLREIRRPQLAGYHVAVIDLKINFSKFKMT
jgi:hypothetical protein